jgi:1-acyl-sn-glycerol-3-phosphate acyltransferase
MSEAPAPDSSRPDAPPRGPAGPTSGSLEPTSETTSGELDAGPPAAPQTSASPGHATSSEDSAHFPSWPLSPAFVWVRRLLHYIFFFPILRWLNPLYIHGRENIDGLEGPFIFVANHASHLDTAALIRAMPVTIRDRMAAAAAQDYFFTSWYRGLFASLTVNAFPFPRKGRAGIERAKWLCSRGWHLMLYPEGTRTTDGSISKFRSGVGRIAVETQAYVVPVAILGMGRVYPKGQPLPKRGSVELRIGQAMRFAPDQDPVEVTAQLEAAVRELALPEGAELARGRVRKR